MDVQDHVVDLVDRPHLVIKVKHFSLKIFLKIILIDSDLVSGEGSSIVTGVTSPTPSVNKFKSSSLIDFVFFSSI